MDERLACLASVLPLKWSVKNENERKKVVDLIVFLVFGLANSLKPIDFIFFIFLLAHFGKSIRYWPAEP